jgi:UPF0176 protein
MSRFAVAALYRFVRLDKPDDLRDQFYQQLESLSIKGTLLIATEGINGTIAGEPEAMHRFIDQMRSMNGGRFADADVKWSDADEPPFRKLRVQVKQEIVTLGCEDLPPGSACDPENTGQYLDPSQWNHLLDDPDVTVVDTRNDYEYEIGTFVGACGPAINPQTHSFREFPGFAADQLDPDSNRKVAMFCTGGIRCEKSTALLKARGFEQVYHLKGGILRYLEEVPEEQSKFRGACFVFDRRVAVEHGLKETEHELCFACGWPTTPVDRASPNYQPGIACPRCHGKHTPEQIERFTMRQRQLEQAAV